MNDFSLDNLVCYKNIIVDSNDKTKFFFEKHSTKEGTWGVLQLHEGSVDFILLDGAGMEISNHRIDQRNPEFFIYPSTWHKLVTVNNNFRASLKFYCKTHRYFNKKYNLSNVHSDLLYVYNCYLKEKPRLSVLDVGCGSGRNSLFLSLSGYQVTGIDINESSIQKIKEIVKKENIIDLNLITHDLHKPLFLEQNSYDFVVSTVTLQFLQVTRISSLLMELQQVTKLMGMHLLVFPIKAEQFTLPDSFSYLATGGELYNFYQNLGWAILEYKESVGQLHRCDNSGKPIQGLFGMLLAQKIDTVSSDT